MGAETKIEWADATWNPWIGCTPVSEGCYHCYARRAIRRFGGDAGKLRRTKPATFNLPLAKKRDASWKIPSGSRVFVCSWSDFFHEGVPEKWWYDALSVMMERRDLRFLLLTKRPDRMAEMLPTKQRGWGVWETRHMKHLWLGVTAENQARADERVPKLLESDWPGKKFVSVEPMLGPIAVYGWRIPQLEISEEGRIVHDGLDWVICGGESGPGARPMKPEWVRNLRDQCVEAGVPFFFKQWGEWAPEDVAHRADLEATDDEPTPSSDSRYGEFHRGDDEWIECCLCEEGEAAMWRLGKKRAGRLLDGREWNEVPE